MKFIRAHLWGRDDGGIATTAIFDVPGIGEIEFKHALSDEICARVRAEAIAALRIRLGQTLKSEEPTLNARALISKSEGENDGKS